MPLSPRERAQLDQASSATRDVLANAVNAARRHVERNPDDMVTPGPAAMLGILLADEKTAKGLLAMAVRTIAVETDWRREDVARSGESGAASETAPPFARNLCTRRASGDV